MSAVAVFARAKARQNHSGRMSATNRYTNVKADIAAASQAITLSLDSLAGIDKQHAQHETAQTERKHGRQPKDEVHCATPFKNASAKHCRCA
jgi:hypothetical protein